MSEKCSAHGLLRCIMCQRPQAPFVKPTSAPIASVPAGRGIDPEDALKSALDGPSVQVGLQGNATGPDKQALEAMERNKAMAAGEKVETDQPAVTPWDDQVKDIPVTVAPHTDYVTEAVKAAVFSSEPAMKVAPRGTHLAGNPIVDAAAAYSHAQEAVEMAIEAENDLAIQLKQAQDYVQRVTEDLAVKKSVLQKLVSD